MDLAPPLRRDPADPAAALRALAGLGRTGARLARLLASPAAFRVSAALEVEIALAGHEGALSVMVASHACGEGRSTVALILAAHAALADADRRVVLVDADTTPGTAKAGLSARLGIGPGRPGLLDHLHGDTTMAEMLVATALPNLHLVPLGRRAGQPPRLPPARLEQAVRELRTVADLIVIDAMPCSAGPEALVAARAARNVVMVVRQAGPTSDDVAESAKEIERTGASVLGCVLNRYRPLLPWPFRDATGWSLR